MTKKAIIIGAGPAGLTAAYELLDKTDIQPVILELSDEIGGIAKTVNYKGNRIDIGGHRFFSKSDRVTQWWQNIMPLQGAPSQDDLILKRDIPLAAQSWQRPIAAQQAQVGPAPDPAKTDGVMLFRQRLSRIFYLRKFFDYPISLSGGTLKNLGLVRLVRIGCSYLKARLLPIKQEKNLEDFLINRFGRELYATFFKDYTQKVWGVPCDHIKPEWGAQRIKGLSISKALMHALKSCFVRDTTVGQKGVETSLIGQFMYPKLGPGQLWEEVARHVQDHGGVLHKHERVIGVATHNGKVVSVTTHNDQERTETTWEGEYFFSTMPMKDLIAATTPAASEDVQRVAQGLQYRDFITVGVLLKKLTVANTSKFKSVNNIIPDNWIYVQEPDVKLCRLQVFNNWSPYMVKDPDTIWLGLEYMCQDDGELWNMPDAELIKFATDELAQIGLVDAADILDTVVLRVPKAYPAYFGSYDELDVVKTFTDQFSNLFLIGRNGQHRYNNQDHSMLSAMVAVENILQGRTDKANVWSVNAEKEYHEEKA